ncbi:hypothetical protein [Streptomyces sp. CB02261]|uniref:hypothetical protein n=1 Tax=Streptomyces sp. CB02261 TaxID=1703940 RepID=UPI00093AC9F9|nr:hypothetical protein [Streptomyces sp. CB02261]OKJ52552.1 hypothetical protein AMK29_30470 [Streptomyces sp. CB02261]
MPQTTPITAERIVAKYATAVASVIGEPPATNLPDFAAQLRTAAVYLERSGINGGDELDTAALYLDDLHALPADKQQAWLEQAAESLKDTADMVAEYHLC